MYALGRRRIVVVIESIGTVVSPAVPPIAIVALPIPIIAFVATLQLVITRATRCPIRAALRAIGIGTRVDT